MSLPNSSLQIAPGLEVGAGGHLSAANLIDGKHHIAVCMADDFGQLYGTMPTYVVETGFMDNTGAIAQFIHNRAGSGVKVIIHSIYNMQTLAPINGVRRTTDLSLFTVLPPEASITGIKTPQKLDSASPNLSPDLLFYTSATINDFLVAFNRIDFMYNYATSSSEETDLAAQVSSGSQHFAHSQVLGNGPYVLNPGHAFRALDDTYWNYTNNTAGQTNIRIVFSVI